MKNIAWYEIVDVENIDSPALAVYPRRIESNIQKMIDIAGGTDHLRPHIKTHKIAEIIEMQLKSGISKFKCATISEAALLASCGAKDVLLAMQPVGKNIARFFELMADFPRTTFSTLVDCNEVIREIERSAIAQKTKVDLWLDINNGMNRTGVEPNEDAVKIYQILDQSLHVVARGLHVYDGHIHESDFEKRREICDNDYKAVLQLHSKLEELGIEVGTIVAGGTPTFPIHSGRDHVEVSPGTTLLWDQGYADSYRDLDFLPAAVLIGNVVSKPKTGLMCLNLGHKSIAAEMPFPRAKILTISDCEQISHSEEHLVVECPNSNLYPVGSIVYAIPTHICPTVIKYQEVLTIEDHSVTGTWKIAARDHKISTP